MRNYLIPILALGAGCASAQTAPSDTPLTFRASYVQQNDDNLFRLPGGANVQALTGRSSTADQIGVTTVGVNLSTTQSLQHFLLDVSLVDNEYQNNSNLNYTATNYQAVWNWSITPRITGNLIATRAETLNSFSDYQNFTQRNKRTDTYNRADAAYQIDGPWSVVGGVSGAQGRNEQAVLTQSDFSSTSADLGARYTFSSGTVITAGARSTDGTYTNRAVPNASLLDDRYNQADTFAQIHWPFSGNGTLDATLTQINRTQPVYSVRNFSGLNSDVLVSWAISGKTSLNANYDRALADYAGSDASYSVTDRILLGGAWVVSPKTKLKASYAVSQVSYLGSPTGVASQRQDTLNDAILSATWEPLQRLVLGFGLQSSIRTSNQAGLDYRSLMTTLSAQYSF